MIVYLAGPINGFTGDERMGWRDESGDYVYEGVNPHIISDAIKKLLEGTK